MKPLIYSCPDVKEKLLSHKVDIYSPKQRFLVFDYETFSEADIGKVGSYEYAIHPSTEVLCASWAVGTRDELREWLKKDHPCKSYAPIREWSRDRSDLRTGQELAKLIKDPTVVIVAHNALFEQAVTRFVLTKHLSKALGITGPFIIPHERFFCTAALAQVYGLPRKLEGACAALKLKHQKDDFGHRLMLRWSKPKKPSKKDPSTRYTKNFDRLVEYCENDIYAEVDLFLTLKPMIPSERALWCYDQKINFRGVTIDRDLIKKIMKLVAEEKKVMTEELRTITKGAVQTGGQRAVIKAWLAKKGVYLPNLQAKTVEDAINDNIVTGDAKRVLELQSWLNKTSLGKLPKFMHYSGSDGKMRFGLNFHAASTGRWGGQGPQTQNIPRGTLKYTLLHEDGTKEERDLAPYACQLIKDGATLEFIRAMFGDPMEVFVSCLRGVIVPEEGKDLYVADFAAIEARILFWVADHKEGCKAFAEGRKMYEEMAMVIFNLTSISKVTKDQRFVGKQTLLGSGYGMGWKKFISSCADLGREVDVQTAKKAINAYRETHPLIPKLWKNMENAAIAAVENPTKTYKINHTEWFMEGKFLCCRLPSGRCLYYYGPHIKYDRTPWGETRPVLYHWGVDSKTKKWVVQKTWGGVLVENVVQAISRDLMALGMLRIEKAGWWVDLTAHDEIIGERDKGTGTVEEFCKLMAGPLPEWAKGAPISVEGWVGSRYRK